MEWPLPLSIRVPLEVCGAQGSVLSASTLSLRGGEGAVIATTNCCVVRVVVSFGGPILSGTKFVLNL